MIHYLLHRPWWHPYTDGGEAWWFCDRCNSMFPAMFRRRWSR